MSEEPLKVGDLVVTVGCKNEAMRPLVGRVGKIYKTSSTYVGNFYLVENADTTPSNFSGGEATCFWAGKHLRRIDPPQDLIEQEQREQLEEPA